ncbi:MAG: RHS repeat-associated core domain-containing protein [Bdellovibrionales bacterium]|nr:RHS repeat-associated core domain-containing protein [Bdellovibrionales bacterium]
MLEFAVEKRVVPHCEYAPYGEVVQETGGFSQYRFGFTGHYTDQESDLIYAKGRYLLPNGRWASADPFFLDHDDLRAEKLETRNNLLADRQRIGLWTYVMNNPVTLLDRNGQWATEVHHSMLDTAFSNESQATIASMKLGSDVVVGIRHSSGERASMLEAVKAQLQPGTAYQHAMRDPGQSPKDAAARTQAFVNEKYSQALAVAKTDPQYAAFLRGQALHAVMDSTSPVHRDKDGNPTVWEGVNSPRQALEHGGSPLSREGMGAAKSSGQFDATVEMLREVDRSQFQIFQ